jgi:hypothetical protein
MKWKLPFASAIAGNERLGRKRLIAAALIGVCSLVLLTSACGADATVGRNHGGPTSGNSKLLPQGSERVKLDPADFTTRIDNPYWPMSQGSKWVYRETDTKGTNQKAVVEVTNKTNV